MISRGLEESIDRLEADDSLWLGILTHTGPVFCAGADLKAISEGRFSELSTKRGGFGGIVLRERTKPLIAAIDGPALAGGTEIALTCDLRVASTAARFGLPEVKRSLIRGGGRPGAPAPHHPRWRIAMEVVLTGDPIGAERALELGLINELCQPGEALDAARRLAARVNANGPLAVRESRRLVLESFTRPTPRRCWQPGGPDGAARHRGLPRGPPGLHREAGPRLEGPLAQTMVGITPWS